MLQVGAQNNLANQTIARFFVLYCPHNDHEVTLNYHEKNTCRFVKIRGCIFIIHEVTLNLPEKN